MTDEGKKKEDVMPIRRRGGTSIGSHSRENRMREEEREDEKECLS
jgi:hypothetical protein